MAAESKKKQTAVDERSNGFQKVPLPPDLERPIPLSENARTVLRKRYLRRGPDGQPVETEQEMFWRVAYHVAKAEAEHGGEVEPMARRFYDLLTTLRFFPNSPTFTGAGTPLGQLAACFVLPIDDDMGRTGSGIFETLRHAALIQQTGGGNGFSFSRLRPKGALVRSSSGAATGPVGFLRVYDQAFGEIAQGGCLVPETLVFTAEGALYLDEIVPQREPGWRAHQLTVATDEGQRESRQAYCNGVAPVLRVRTEEGLELTGTPNHKVKVMTAQGPAWRRLDELQTGDAVLVKLGQHQGRRQTLKHPVRQHGNQVMPSLPAVLDEEFAFFLGYLTGDGFVASGDHDHRVGVTVAHSSYLLAEMPALFKRLFGEQIHVHRQQKADDASVTFWVDNRAVKDFLLLNGLDNPASTQARVPRLIRQSPPEVVGAYLRGLFEADGALSHGYPLLMSSSETLIREVAVLLIGLGCPVRIARQPQSAARYGTAPMYALRVHSFVGLKAWRERIGCDPASRFAACLEFEPDLTREGTYPLPHAAYWIEPVLEAITLPQIDARGRGTGKKLHASDPWLRKQLLRYVRGERQLTLSGYELLRNQSEEFAAHARPLNDLWFVRVATVEPAGESLTLDLEVDDNHTYLAGGWVTHNSRRGANMAVLRVDHPDIREFITCKTDENAITNFNISVGITDAFMRAVEEDADFDLVNPQDGSVWETVRARELFDLIVRQAYHNGEPGVLFLDTANKQNPVPHLYELESTNPCGEQFLGPFENCCLGSINLAQHLTPDDRLDWDKLAESVELSTRFLDDVVTANAYVPAVPQLKEAALKVRRIGLGIMGLADVMYVLGVRYGSEEGQEFASQLMEFVRYHAMRTSIALARERGPFPAIKGSIYDPDNLVWQPPRPLVPYQRDWGRPPLDWSQIVEGIKQHGIRNGAQLTIAPTGTISTVAGIEGYGCEPVFALAYTRYVNDNGKQITLQYTSPLFERALRRAGLDDAQIAAIVEQVNLTGTCQDVPGVPEEIRRVFVVSSDVTAEEHVRMQAALQAFTDNAISKTINFPITATEDDVRTAYLLGWKLGCKGMTVYVTGSREKVVLETAKTRQMKEKGEQPTSQIRLFNEEKKPRPRFLEGKTYRVETPLGATYVTVNENGEGKGQPFEVFIHTAKAGSDTAAVSEALGRLISYILRLVSPVPPRNRLREVVRQLAGIGGVRAVGFGPYRVSSLPDGISQVLQEYLNESEENTGDGSVTASRPPAAQLPLQLDEKPQGDLCPECGAATLVNEEGCRKCYSCGFSEC
jgi:ribonucleoside-diphosphate reductase alpha chain